MDVLLYPFHNSLEAIMKYKHKVVFEMNIKYCVIPRAWKNTINLNYVDVTIDFENSLDKVDGVVILDCNEFQYMYSDVIKKIRKTLESNKKVFCFTKLQKSDYNAFIAEEKFHYYGDNDFEETIPKYVPCECVLIGIGGVSMKLNTNAVLINLVEKLKDNEYNAVGISTDTSTKLLGYTIFPDSIFEQNISEENKIVNINCFFNKVHRNTCADVIVFQMPDGMLKYSTQCYERFGIRSYMVSQAVAVDYFILDSVIDMINPDEYMELSREFKYKFGYAIDSIGMEKYRIDEASSWEDEEIKLIKDSTDICEYITQCNKIMKDITAFSVDNCLSYTKLVEDIISKLSGAVEKI